MILVTAFNPFGKFNQNSSFEALKRASLPEGIKKCFLPVDELETIKELNDTINENKIDLLIMFGQSGHTRHVAIEKRAKNILTVDGVNKKIPGKETLETSIDVLGLEKYLNYAHIPSKVNSDAGAFICNFSYYMMLKKGIKTIFIHLPLFTGQTLESDYHFLDILTLTRAVELTVRYFQENRI